MRKIIIMEKMKIIFLGVSGSVPRKDSNFASCLVSFNGENLLFDAPEGLQRQLMNSSVSLMKINHCFISHMHLDHFLGLFGWIATMNLNQRKEKLTIYSPKGGKEKIKKILNEVIKPDFEIEFKEIKTGIIFKNSFLEVKSFKLEHDIPCFGFSVKEKDILGRFDRKKAEKLGIPPGPLYSKLVEGKTITVNGKKFKKNDVFDYSKKRIGRKIAIIADTKSTTKITNNVKNADILIHEATFLEDKKERAIQTKHSTAKDAATLAKKARVKKLFLFHFSASITDFKIAQKEASEIFKESFIASDFDEIIL